MTITVRDNPEQSRDEIRDGRTPAGLSAYGITGRRTDAVDGVDAVGGLVLPQAPAPARVSR